MPSPAADGSHGCPVNDSTAKDIEGGQAVTYDRDTNAARAVKKKVIDYMVYENVEAIV